MNQERVLRDSERCDNCTTPPGTRCESNPSGCPYKQERESSREESFTLRKFVNLTGTELVDLIASPNLGDIIKGLQKELNKDKN
jgi:hypothetical protein